MALAQLALELLYVRGLLAHLGHEFITEQLSVATKDPEAHRQVHAVGDIMHGPTTIGVDNSGAHSLCNRTTNGKNSRHVERKVYKMRELRREGIVKLVLVGTKDMDADIMTKHVDDATFERHRATILNLGAAVPQAGGG